MRLLKQNQRDYINTLMKRVDPSWLGHFTVEHAEKYGLSETEVRWGFTIEQASTFIDMLKSGAITASHHTEQREQRHASNLLSEWEPRRLDTTVHNVGYGVARPRHLNVGLPKQKDFD